MTLLERAARAAHDTMMQRSKPPGLKLEAWDELHKWENLSQAMRDDWIAAVQAAIESLKEAP